MPLPCVHLRPRRARPFFARHPWVLIGSIERVEGDPPPGTEVRVLSHEGAFIARGLYNPHSLIRVRLYRWEDQQLDAAFWRQRLEHARELRTATLGLVEPGRACRLVYSESDGLSGLTVDQYDRWLVALFSSRALYEHRAAILPQLAEVAAPEGILVRFDRGVSRLEGFAEPPEPEPIGAVPAEPVTIVEHDLHYAVDLRGGQKTGWYLDQRENRLAVARLARGRRVLDLYCHAGGFALTALRHGGATEALGVDSSAAAIASAVQNAAANGITTAHFEAGDVLETLARLHQEGQRFGLVVCDPPKFARTRDNVPTAMKAYARVNRAILPVLEPGGVLATCSCSGAVDAGLFAEMQGEVARSAGRDIQILERRGQAPDHPVSASCLETEYLKCFVCRVV